MNERGGYTQLKYLSLSDMSLTLSFSSSLYLYFLSFSLFTPTTTVRTPQHNKTQLWAVVFPLPFEWDGSITPYYLYMPKKMSKVRVTVWVLDGMLGRLKSRPFIRELLFIRARTCGDKREEGEGSMQVQGDRILELYTHPLWRLEQLLILSKFHTFSLKKDKMLFSY